MPTSVPHTFLMTKVLVQQDDTKGSEHPVHWSPMGREGGVLHELTKTREMFLAWVYRGLLAVLVGLAGVTLAIVAHDAADMQAKLEALPIAIGVVSNAQKETDAGVKVLTQMIKDRTALRDVQLEGFKAKQDADERQLAEHEKRIQGLERGGR